MLMMGPMMSPYRLTAKRARLDWNEKMDITSMTGESWTASVLNSMVPFSALVIKQRQDLKKSKTKALKARLSSVYRTLLAS